MGNTPPRVDVRATLPLYQALHAAIRAGLVRSASTPGKGGLALALARSAMAGSLGADVDFTGCARAESLDDDLLLFAETNGRFVVTVADRDAEAFAQYFEGMACHRDWRGHGSRQELKIRRGERGLIDTQVEALRGRFKEGLEHA